MISSIRLCPLYDLEFDLLHISMDIHEYNGMAISILFVGISDRNFKNDIDLICYLIIVFKNMKMNLADLRLETN